MPEGAVEIVPPSGDAQRGDGPSHGIAVVGVGAPRPEHA